MAFLSDLNSWIIDHQAITVAVGVPLLSAVSASIVALITNRSSIRASERERRLQVQSKLADIEAARLNDLREDLTTLLTLTFFINDDPDHSHQKQIKEIFHVSKRIQLSLDWLSDGSDRVVESMNIALKAILENPEDPGLDSINRLQMSAIELLSVSWLKLKHELLSITEGQAKK